MKINIKDFSILAGVGIYPHEKTEQTRILVSITIETNETRIIDYDEIIKLTKEFILSKHYEYIEEIASGLCIALKKEFNLTKKAFVKVQKCIFTDTISEISVECKK